MQIREVRKGVAQPEKDSTEIEVCNLNINNPKTSISVMKNWDENGPYDTLRAWQV